MPITPTEGNTLPSATALADTPDDSPAHATSFGTFKPVGHVMVGLANRAALRSLAHALQEPGVPGLPVDELTPAESIEEMQALIDNASPLAGFGHELTLMRRYVELARQGHCWLIVKVDSDEDAARVGELAKRFGATLAVRYGRFMVEDLI